MVAPANPRGTPAAPRSHLTVTARRRRLIQVHLSCRIYSRLQNGMQSRAARFRARGSQGVARDHTRTPRTLMALEGRV